MKANTTETIKFKKLKMRLKLSQWQTVGLLESIWSVTANSAQRGDIGKFSNEDIAASIEWDGDPDDLILTLIECGWIDECEENRLLIHGWSEHCPTYIKGNLAKHGKEFAKHVAKEYAKEAALEHASDTPLDGATKSSQVKSIQVKSSEANSSQDKHLPARSAKKPPISGPTWEAYSNAYFHRYGVEPTRNATVNGQLANFVKRIGADEAPHVAAFFLTNNSQWYITKAHSVASMLNDAEKLHTEWKTGRQITATTARQKDKTQSNYNAFAPLLEEARNARKAD